MKYSIVMCLFILSGCAHIRAETVSVVTEPENGSVVNIPSAFHKQPEEPACRIETVASLDELALKPVESSPSQEPAKESWDLPPFTWAPGWCSNADAAIWPDFSAVHSTECTWWLFPPIPGDQSLCESSWELANNMWIHKDTRCEKIKRRKRARTRKKVTPVW